MAIIGTNDTATVRVASLPSGAAFDTAANVTFSATGSISATNVQAAIAELDTEKAPLSNPNFTTGISVDGVQQKRTYALVIADDAVGSIDLTARANGGILEMVQFADPAYSFPSQVFAATIFYDVGGSLAIGKTTATYIGGSVDVVTTNVTGTSGTDGRITVSAQTDTIKIENRSNNIAYFLVTVN